MKKEVYAQKERVKIFIRRTERVKMNAYSSAISKKMCIFADVTKYVPAMWKCGEA